MAKIKYMDLVDRVQGKFCKEDPTGAIFAYRKDTGVNYVYHRHNVSTAPASAAQEAQKARFKATVSTVKSIMKDVEQVQPYVEAWRKNPGKYGTLRGYIFAQVMAGIE